MSAATWDGYPSYASQDFFRESMEGHTEVLRVDKISPSRWDLSLSAGIEVRVFITDIYTFSQADYAQLRAQHGDVDLIVSASKWNHFSSEVTKDAARDGVATAMLGTDLMRLLHQLARP